MNCPPQSDEKLQLTGLPAALPVSRSDCSVWCLTKIIPTSSAINNTLWWSSTHTRVEWEPLRPTPLAACHVSTPAMRAVYSYSPVSSTHQGTSKLFDGFVTWRRNNSCRCKGLAASMCEGLAVLWLTLRLINWMRREVEEVLSQCPLGKYVCTQHAAARDATCLDVEKADLWTLWYFLCTTRGSLHWLTIRYTWPSDNIPLVLILEGVCKHRDLIIVINKSIQHRH